MKKEYKAPTIISEPIKIGVFGGYGGNCNPPPITGGEPLQNHNFGWFVLWHKRGQRG